MHLVLLGPFLNGNRVIRLTGNPPERQRAAQGSHWYTVMLSSGFGAGNEDKWLFQLTLQEDVCEKNGITSKEFWIGPHPYANEMRLACKNKRHWHLTFMSLLRGTTRLGLGKNNRFTKHIDHM